MAIKRIRIIILCILFTQSLSLPSGCIESCITYQKVSSYRTHQESNNRNYQTDSNIRNINHSNLDYNRPDNWTEQNEYKIDNGRGKVYEEQGQYVEGPKRVRFFKKNYTSSYSNTHASKPDLLQSERLINQNGYNSLDTTDNQRIYEKSKNSESYRQERNYNKLHNDQLQQQSYRERESHIGRPENFVELSDSLQMSDTQHKQDYKRYFKNLKDYLQEKLTYSNYDLQSLKQPNQDLKQNTKNMMQQTQNNKKHRIDNQRLEDLTQHFEDLTQQTNDLTQQTSRNLEFGQLNQKPSNDNQRFEDLNQQTSGHIEFSQPNQKPNSHNQHSQDFKQQTDDLTQQTGGFDDLTQQTSGHIEFGQLNQKPSSNSQHSQDLTQQIDDLRQQTGGLDDLSQQTFRHIEFGQLNQKPSSNSQHSQDLTQQTDDLTQQTGGFDDLTQQTSGHIEFGQTNQKTCSHSQHSQDLTQQTDDLRQQTGGLDDLTQQTSGHIEFDQLHQKPSNHNQLSDDFSEQNVDSTQQINGWDDIAQPILGHSVNERQKQQLHYNYSFRHNQQFTNEEYLYPRVSGTAKQLDINKAKSLHLLTPAPKPKWKLRDRLLSQTLTDSTENPSGIYIHHSSDITDHTVSYQNQLLYDSNPIQEVGSNNDFYSINVQSSNQQEDPIQLNSQRIIKNGNQQRNSYNRNGFTKGGHKSRHIYRPSTQSQYPISNSVSQPQLNQDLNLEEIYRKRKNQNNNQENISSQNSNPKDKIEPRILEAYGGGPYDVNHDDDIFNHVTQNPGAILPPHSDGIDPWDIREKPREVIPLSTTMITTPEITEKVETEIPPTFWTKLGHKFTTTFDKAKEKAKDLFG